MNIIISILLLFILPANIILLALFGYRKIKFKKKILFFASHGMAPLLIGLFLYYLIWLFPARDNIFYLGIIMAFWLVFLVFYIGNWRKFISFYRELHFLLKSEFFKKRNLLFFPIVFFVILFSVQALFYPIVDNDKALYLSQSEAVYKHKNLEWKKNNSVLIRGGDEYNYNSAIRPAIPHFMAFSFMIGKDGGYFVFKFLSGYYYFLLLGIFLVVVRELAGKLKQDKFKAIFFGSIFFVFSWTLIRSFIFNSKETIIYFLALLSLYLAYLLIKSKKRNYPIEILLSVVIGLNMFVNLHGIIIGVFILVLLFIFSSLNWWNKIKQSFLVFLTSLLFGAFEFLKMFNFIFASNIEAIKNFIADIWKKIIDFFSGIRLPDLDSTSPAEPASSLDEGHLGLYQISSFLDLYIKGKLQILTNVGVFGFNFWLFLFVATANFKKILSSKIGKIILSFIVVYFIVVLDPFNLNKHKFAVVLWGSTKYASLVMLLGLIFVSVYTNWFFVGLLNFLRKKATFFIVFVGVSFGIIIFLKEKIIAIGVKVLFSVIPKFKNLSFYYEKVELFYYLSLFFIGFIFLVLVFLKFKEKKFSYYLLVISSVYIFVLVPFFMTDVGKVEIFNTFKYIDKEREVKLKNIIYYGDIYKVYFYAKRHLPEGSTMNAGNEVYTYDDYFKLRRNPKDVKYRIKQKCGENFYSIYKEKRFKLCERR